jgi:hypothetical protein
MKIALLAFCLLFSISCATSNPKNNIPPSAMVFVEGGMVIIGDYKKDETHWGKREAFIKSFYIDAQPRQVDFFANQDCMKRKGRLPEEAELNLAFSLKKIELVKNFEITESDINFEGSRGGGYNLRVLNSDELKIVKPTAADIKGSVQRRCLIPLNRDYDKDIYTLKNDIHPRTGRGDNWPELPLELKKDSKVSLFYRDENWSLVDLEVDGPDSGGWVPSALISR